MVVLLLVMIDVVILFIFMASEGPKGNLLAKRIPSRENPVDVEGVRFEYHYKTPVPLNYIVCRLYK